MSIINQNKYKIVLNWFLLFASILSPFIAFPFLSRILEQNNFGIYLTILAFTSFLVIFSDYGFNVSSARRLAINDYDLRIKSEIIITTSILKLFLTLGVIILFVCTVNIFDNLKAIKDILLPSIILIFSLSMQPLWYFIGSKKVIINSLLVLCSRLAPLPFLFYFIQSSEDLFLTIYIQSIAAGICMFISYLFILKNEKLVFNIPKIKTFISYLREDIMLFFSNILIGIYASLNPVLLGINLSFIEVATYAGIERIFKTIESFIASSSSIFFPSIAKTINQEPKDASNSIKQIVKFYFVLGFFVIVVSFFFGSYLLELLYGKDFNSSSHALYIMMFIPLFGSMGTAFGNLGLLNLRKNYQFFKILLSGALVNIAIIYLAATAYGAVAGAMASFFTAIIIASQMYYYFIKELNSKEES
ncbi:oligosaccharide flippase family protein [Gammaproteobacteria bacterium]|nr:oligosaccharide flippase family protein [Gammaproteobacteria bacterium]